MTMIKKLDHNGNDWTPADDKCTELEAHVLISNAKMPKKGYKPVWNLRGSLPKSGPLDFATKNTFPLFFVGEEALVGIY